MPEVMTAQAQFIKKTPLMQERKYKCEYCARAFSRSEHRSRHERSRAYLVFLPLSNAIVLTNPTHL